MRKLPVFIFTLLIYNIICLLASPSSPENKPIGKPSQSINKQEILGLIDQTGQYSYAGKYDSAYLIIRHAYRLVASTNDPGLQFHVLLELAKIEFSMEMMDSMKVRRMQIESFCDGRAPDSLCARAYNLLGRESDYIGSFQDTKEYFEKAYQIFLELGDTNGAAAISQNVGVVFQGKGMFDKALERFLEALSYFERKNQMQKIPLILNNIAMLHIDMNEPERAIPYIDRAIEVSTALNSPFDSYTGYLHRSIALQALKDFQGSLKSLELAEKYLPTPPPPSRLARISYSRGGVEMEMGNLRAAEKSFKEVVELSAKAGIPIGMSKGYLGLGQIYLKTERFEDAEKAFRLSMNILPDQEDKIMRLEGYSGLSQALKGQSRFEEALDYAEYYTELRDSIFSDEKTKALAELQIRYETDQIEKENELLKREKGMQKEILQTRESTLRRRNLAVFVISLFSIGLLVLILLFIRERKRLKHTLLRLHEKNAEISSQQEVLQQLINTRDRFFSIIAHDLKSPFNALLGLSVYMIEHYDAFTEEEKKHNIQRIHDASLSTYALLENLLTWARSQRGEIQQNPACLNLSVLVQNTLTLFETKASTKSIKVATDVSSDIHVFADEAMFQSILRNLINNAMKFSYKDSMVHISAAVKQDKVDVVIQDQGIGMTEDELGLLFRIDKVFSNVGTDNEAGTGLGLIMCKDFIERNQGRLYITSKPGQGTEVRLELPAC